MSIRKSMISIFVIVVTVVLSVWGISYYTSNEYKVDGVWTGEFRCLP